MRLISNPQDIVSEYTKWLGFEYQRASGIRTLAKDVRTFELNGLAEFPNNV